MQVNTFFPIGNTVVFNADTLSDRTALTSYNPSTGTVRIYNSGLVDAFVSFGTSAVTAATTTSMPIRAGNTEVFGLGDSLIGVGITPPTHIAAITGSGSVNLYITSGVGA